MRGFLKYFDLHRSVCFLKVILISEVCCRKIDYWYKHALVKYWQYIYTYTENMYISA